MLVEQSLQHLGLHLRVVNASENFYNATTTVGVCVCDVLQWTSQAMAGRANICITAYIYYNIEASLFL